MSKISATGKHSGEYLHIVVEDGKTFVDDEESDIYDYLLKEVVHSIGGTYYPEKGSMLNIYNNLQFNFFEDRPKIKVDGDIGEIPSSEDVIY